MDAFFFIIKNIVSRALYPVGLTLWISFLGFVFWKRKPKSNLGPLMVFSGFLILLCCSVPLLGWGMLWSLESQTTYTDLTQLKEKQIQYIVVLSGSMRSGDRPYTDRLDRASTIRTLEGIRLFKELDKSRLILSGGALLGEEPCALAMADLAKECGVPKQSILMESESWNTEDQARNLAKVLKGKPFALVTSASHMPRSLLLFKSYGLKPLACPTDFTTGHFSLDLGKILPSGRGLTMVDRALHEYMGLVVIWLKDKD